MATDGNWNATKKFTAIVKGSLKGAERKAKKKDPTLEQSSALPNEVLKGCFGTTPKTIGSSRRVKVGSKWGKLENFCIRVFCPSPA